MKFHARKVGDVFTTADELGEKLRAQRYIIDPVTLEVVYLASASIMVEKYLRPAAVDAGIIPADWKGRFGFHNFRTPWRPSL